MIDINRVEGISIDAKEDVSNIIDDVLEKVNLLLKNNGLPTIKSYTVDTSCDQHTAILSLDNLSKQSRNEAYTNLFGI